MDLSIERFCRSIAYLAVRNTAIYGIGASMDASSPRSGFRMTLAPGLYFSPDWRELEFSALAHELTFSSMVVVAGYWVCEVPHRRVERL